MYMGDLLQKESQIGNFGLSVKEKGHNKDRFSVFSSDSDLKNPPNFVLFRLRHKHEHEH